ncbi:hypothetical protein D8674_007643 [Pyrus ussuriensis x Pyrus communis]|uniref:Uncharacterized protein n=1 Tax=Pyrus ussuriensis x Pyrus communis TaxID=2448454 RepID=A0A5N5I3F0_9ROSA|nr:hypothetical protein D8674_007643 [Pyrus ussuriensis x Pyrus communis]
MQGRGWGRGDERGGKRWKRQRREEGRRSSKLPPTPKQEREINKERDPSTN